MKRYGQSIIEYILIAVLVILGVVIMGTYVLRSTNANFKMWDEGVQDSFQENLLQAPRGVIPNVSLDCNCTSTPLGCGLSTPTSQCPANAMTYNHSCTPNQGCDGAPASYCNVDLSCCDVYYRVGCGTTPIPDTGIDTTPCTSIPTGTTLPSGATCPAIASGSRNCYYGEEIYATQCSTLPIVCVPSTDPACAPTCGGINIVGAGGNPSACYCDGSPLGGCSNTMPSDLNKSRDITYVSGQPNCSQASPYPNSQKCVMFCNQDKGFIPVPGPNGTITGCLDTYAVAPFVDGACPKGSTGNANCETQKTACCYNSGFTTVNNTSYTVCATVPNLTIDGVTSTAETQSSCTSCACCSDNCDDSDPTKCFCSSPGQCTGVEAHPGCGCMVNLSVTNS